MVVKNYIKAIAKWMAEKGRNVVYFDKNTYDDWKSDMPHFLDAETGKCFYITELRTDGEVLKVVVVLKRGRVPYEGVLNGVDENTVSLTDGKAETFYYELFNNVYNAICDAEDADQDEWLEKNFPNLI